MGDGAASQRPPRLSTLDEVRAAIWQDLRRAPRDRFHAWRTPVLATVAVGDDGPQADARTVVLREVDEDANTLTVFTDARSAKATQLQHHPAATLVMWSPRLGWQLRCRVRCELAVDGLRVSSRWARVKLSPAAQDYLSPLPPGAPLPTDPALAMASHDAPASGAIASGGAAPRDHFAVITAHLDAIDWLELHPDGHRRARFDARGGAWLQP